ncbi:MAG: hypothetical protein EOP21_08325 [Hyphomicrobiales bacterium]|nr:MAG: hypothetical protein EOP21_08325 [Hyphomicrobiales bacterium]
MSVPTAFSPEVLGALFEAVEMDDVVDPVVSLPDTIPTACDQDEMRRCLALCIQFWREGAIRADLKTLVNALLWTGDLPPKDRRRYKLIRARYKHLRFALVLYGTQHRAPALFRATVVAMGHLQDAYRNNRRSAVLGYALALRVLMTRAIWWAVHREVARVRIDDAAGFHDYRRGEIARLDQWLADPSLTAHRFHAMRKIVSRLVSFYDTRRCIEPDNCSLRMSRYLSAINGLMGEMHDDLVERAMVGQQDYYRDALVLPSDIHKRLRALTKAYLGLHHNQDRAPGSSLRQPAGPRPAPALHAYTDEA